MTIANAAFILSRVNRFWLAALMSQAWARPLPEGLDCKPAPDGSACAQVCVDAKHRGAYYRKIQTRVYDDGESAPDGIIGFARLPDFAFEEDDKDRMFPWRPNPDWKKQGADSWLCQIGPMDRASVYVGGNFGGQEIDVGLIWRPVLDGRGQYAKDRKGRPVFGFRPFWRDAGWHEPNYSDDDNVYFHPGDAVAMKLTTAGSGLQISITGAGGKSFAKALGVPAGPRSFKRVNSIDQYVLAGGRPVGNERDCFIPTRARASGGVWNSVKLVSGSKKEPLAGASCLEVRGGDAAPAYDQIFRLAPEKGGGESIDIGPGGISCR